MARRHTFLLLLLAVAFVGTWSTTGVAVAAAPSKDQWPAATASEVDAGLDDPGDWAAPVCDGLVGDCIDQGEEMAMESEVSRRSLRGRRRYISYFALLKNRVPCSRRGQSYYNCRPQARVNPYRRACTVITRCARFLD